MKDPKKPNNPINKRTPEEKKCLLQEIQTFVEEYKVCFRNEDWEETGRIKQSILQIFQIPENHPNTNDWFAGIINKYGKKPAPLAPEILENQETIAQKFRDQIILQPLEEDNKGPLKIKDSGPAMKRIVNPKLDTTTAETIMQSSEFIIDSQVNPNVVAGPVRPASKNPPNEINDLEGLNRQLPSMNRERNRDSSSLEWITPKVVEESMAEVEARLGPDHFREMKYTLEKQLGKGGFGAVYKIRDDRGNRFLALKVLHKDPDNTDYEKTKERFDRELELGDRLKECQNIIHVHNFQPFENEYIGFYMEYFEGTDLTHSLGKYADINSIPLEKLKKQTFKKFVTHMIQVAEALGALHAKGVIHRDIKPDNIMINNNEVKLADLGIARDKKAKKNRLPDKKDHWAFHQTLKESGAESKLTQCGDILGTPGYMPPEQALSADSADERSDIFAFGMTLFTILNQQNPLKPDNMDLLAILYHLTSEDFRVTRAPFETNNLTDAKFKKQGEKLNAICLKCLEKDPNKRYQKASELQVALKEVLFGLDASPTKFIQKKIERNPIPTIVGATALTLTALLGTYVYQKAQTKQAEKLAKEEEAKRKEIEEKNSAKIESGDGYSLIVRYKNCSFNLSESLTNCDFNKHGTVQKTFDDIRAANFFEIQAPNENNQAKLLVSFIQILGDNITINNVPTKALKVDWYDVVFQMTKQTGTENIWTSSEFKLSPRHSAAFPYTSETFSAAVKQAFTKATKLNEQSKKDYEKYKLIDDFTHVQSK